MRDSKLLFESVDLNLVFKICSLKTPAHMSMSLQSLVELANICMLFTTQYTVMNKCCIHKCLSTHTLYKKCTFFIQRM